MQKNTIEKAFIYAESLLQNAESAHDIWHVRRVLALARHISSTFPKNSISLPIIELSALLHDVYDHKFCKDEQEGISHLSLFLDSLALLPEEKTHILAIIKNLSFSKNNPEKISSLEFQIVQDADRLDAIGAIGIARVFSYSGYKKRPFYNPENPDENTAIKHFYDKLLLLKDKMNTPEGKRLATPRHAYLESFLKEWEEEQFPCNM